MRWMMTTLMLAAMALPSAALASNEHFDWSSRTFVVWPLRDDAPGQHVAVTLSDWYRVGAMSQRPGTRFILNSIALSGIRTVWWRVMDGGQCMYPTQVDGATVARLADIGYDCEAFDHLEEAVTFGHQLGLKVYAWMPFLEEAHAWPECARGHYVDAHRDQWDRTIDGKPSGAPSFYFKDFRDYKLRIAEELLTRYAIDGLVLDFERTGAPHRGNKVGYLPQAVDVYRRRTGIDPLRLSIDDPDWAAFRAGYIGAFIKDVRACVDGLGRPVDLVMMYRANKPLSAWCDAKKWADEDYFDLAVLVDYGPEGWGTAADKPERWREQAKELGIPAGMVFYSSGKVSLDAYMARARSVLQNGFDPIVYFESTHLFWNSRFQTPVSLAAPSQARIISPPVDLAGGGAVSVLAAGQWKLWLDVAGGDPLSSGGADEMVEVRLPPLPGARRLVIECALPRGSQKTGVAVEGWAVDAAGNRQAIRTDGAWRADDTAATLGIVGQPGIPPFLGIGSERAGEGE